MAGYNTTVLLDPQVKKEVPVFQLGDDFLWFISPHLWTASSAGGGTSPAYDTANVNPGGCVKFVTGAGAGQESMLGTTQAPFLFAAGKPLECECLLNYAEQATNKAAIAFGFGDVIATTGFMTSNGTVLVGTFSGAIIYKLAGETVWRCGVSIGTTNVLSKSNTTAGAAGPVIVGQQLNFQKLRIDIEASHDAAGQVTVTYFVNDVQLTDSVTGLKIAHTIAYSGATAMKVGVYSVAGAATSEIAYVDYINALQQR